MTSTPSRSRSPRTRRTSEQRREEILGAAVGLAMTEGLESVTLRSVSEAVGITGGLVGHYFPAVDELLAEVFRTAAQQEIDDLLVLVRREADPLDSLRALLRLVVSDDRDPITLLWIDAWHAGRRRPAVRREVNRLSTAWMDLITTLLLEGRAAGQLSVVEPAASATRILAMIDAHGLQSVMREAIDYQPVRDLVAQVTEQELGLPAGSISLGDDRAPAGPRTD